MKLGLSFVCVSGKLLRYALRSGTKPREEKSPVAAAAAVAELSNHSASKRYN